MPAPENALIMPSVDLRATRHKAAFERAMAAAAEVFDDLMPFHAAFVAAMNDADSAAVGRIVSTATHGARGDR